MTRQKKPDDLSTQDEGGAAAGDPPVGGSSTGASDAPPATDAETPAHALSDGLEMPSAGGSYIRRPDGTLVKQEG